MSTEGAGVALGASYRLEERLGRGAMGEVWRAVDRRTDEVVAAKLLRSEHATDQDLVGRFVRERSILTGLRHPHVVAVRDLVVEGDQLAIVMDYVDGGTLRDVLARGPLPPERAAAVVAAALEGIAAAHARGILHRDIKPDNVLLSKDWHDLDPGAVRLTDFGIARMVADGAGTTTGLMGTPEYMAPELLVTGTCDLSADVYGTGILLYELLAGRTPFAGPGTDYTVAHRHVASVPPPLPVPEALAVQLDAMLSKDPTARPSAADAAAALRRVAPTLAGLPALETQAPPADFDSARGPMTMLRGVTPEPEPAVADPAEGDDDVRLSAPDLGASDHGTMLRPMSVPTTTREETRREPARAQRKKQTPRWRDPRTLALIAATLVLLGGAVAYAASTGTGGKEPGPTTPTAAPPPATSSDTATRAGLTVDRNAVYDPQTESVALTLTYSAQNAPLEGPFLEVIPETDGGDCPNVTWEQGTGTRDSGSGGLGTPCGWSIDPGGPVPAQGQMVVTATISLPFGTSDPGTELQSWLDDAQQRTQEALVDPSVDTAVYPVQRLTDVVVQAPSSTVSGRTLRVVVLPVWAGGEPDPINPIFDSQNIGEPTSVLSAIAGGYDGLRFTDGCSGNLVVSGGGLYVTAGGFSTGCVVNATVGNIQDVPSNEFAISPRGS